MLIYQKRLFSFVQVSSGIIFLLLLLICCTGKVDKEIKMPEENRFQRVVIKEDLYMPTELEIAEDGFIYFAEANGKFSKVDPKTKKSSLIGTVKNFDNYEHGLIGMALDPDFIHSRWVYFQYFLPSIKKPIAQVSRFTITGDTLDITSEKKYVQIPYDDACCHTGGSLSFDSKGNLYFSTGDNVDAFETTYSPHDERPGHEIANGLRSAANSMDLRGKICRVHPERDGSYTIPGDNLFADGKHGRPEIYIMGCRNPYRVFADKKTDILYWGEVGPDAIADSTVGPQGYDEFNIAKKAGNYGWPMFTGNNIPYAHLDFEKKQL